MERKYYLRGLGIGIVMTAIIMGIALSGNHKMTDEEIIARAKELGMVEDTYLSDLDDSKQQEEQNIEETEPEGAKEQPEPEPENPQVPQKPSETPESATPAEETEATESPLEAAQPVEEEPVKAEPDTQEVQEPEEAQERAKTQTEPGMADTNEMTKQDDKPSASVKIERVTVASGDGSYQVALKLKEAGVVMSAETFDDFLCEKGYDKKLRTGTFRIPTDASDEQIARILTGQE